MGNQNAKPESGVRVEPLFSEIRSQTYRAKRESFPWRGRGLPFTCVSTTTWRSKSAERRKLGSISKARCDMFWSLSRRAVVVVGAPSLNSGAASFFPPNKHLLAAGGEFYNKRSNSYPRWGRCKLDPGLKAPWFQKVQPNET